MTGAEFDRMLEEILAEYGIRLEDVQKRKKPLPETQSGKRRCRDTAEIRIQFQYTLLKRFCQGGTVHAGKNQRAGD